MTYLEKAQDLYAKAESDLLNALDTYYADDVEIIEANGETFHGKETQRGRLVEWQQGIEAYHGSGVHAVTSNEAAGTTVVESWADATFKGAGRMRIDEVAIQTWKDGKIVRERFYYFGN
ncbi:MAG: nuclear transport factor 2 family protein [Bacteroidota bacterium]